MKPQIVSVEIVPGRPHVCDLGRQALYNVRLVRNRFEKVMPIYEYQCQQCDHQLEAIQKMSDDPLTDCPACEEPQLRKLVSAAAFRLKGGGWYETDFKKGDKKNLADSGNGESKASDSANGTSKPADSKPASSEPSKPEKKTAKAE